MGLILGMLYRAFVYLVALYYLPTAFFKGLFGDRANWEVLGIYQGREKAELISSLWIHCSSVGEVKVAAILIEAIHRLAPDREVVLTVRTAAGREQAVQILENKAHIAFCPYEIKSLISRAIDRFYPGQLVLIETELWPNLISTALKRNLKVFLVNGRISEKSYHGYLRGKSLLSPLLQQFSCFFMQSQADVERIVAIGAPPSKCRVADNLKFAMMQKDLQAVDPRRAAQKFGVTHGEPLIVAGSTRGGEEKILIEAFQKLKSAYPNLQMIIAPRHLLRLDEVKSYLEQARICYRLYSQGYEQGLGNNRDVILLDTIGELLAAYSLARVAFVGGSLVPRGGQNPLEPVGLGVPTCFGPYTDNFAEIVRLLLENHLAVQVKDGSELLSFFEAVLRGEVSPPRATELLNRFGGSAEIIAREITRAG